MTDIIEMVKAEIKHQQSFLEPLESGKFKLGEYRDGRFVEDITQIQIDRIKRTVTMLQSIVDHENNKKP